MEDDDFSDDENSEEYEQFLQLDEDVVNPVPSQLLEQLPSSEFTEANAKNFSEENKQCAICQCQYEVKEKYIILQCLHRFHTECVTTWFERKNTCPICKRRVGDEESQSLEPGQMIQRQVLTLNERVSIQELIRDRFLPPSDNLYRPWDGRRENQAPRQSIQLVRGQSSDDSSPSEPEYQERSAFEDEESNGDQKNNRLDFYERGNVGSAVNLFAERGTGQRGATSTNSNLAYRGVRQILDEDQAQPQLNNFNVRPAFYEDAGENPNARAGVSGRSLEDRRAQREDLQMPAFNQMVIAPN